MTSFAGVETWPILEDEEISDMEIPEKVSLNVLIFYNVKSLAYFVQR